MFGSSVDRGYRAGIAIAILTSFLSVWTTIVRDDGEGVGAFMIILAAMVGGLAAWFRPAGMTRAMAGVAVMQLLLGIAIATAPITAATPDGPFRALLFNGVFAGLWLVSAGFFRSAAKAEGLASQSV